MSRILAVDPGDRRIGLAISDPTRTLAQPLATVQHSSRAQDARAILARAQEEGAGAIVVGLALGAQGEIGPQARKCQRLARELQEQSDIPIVTWDESGTTMRAADLGQVDDLDATAAALLLQDYLDAQKKR